jgi:hypothetical protein
MKNHDEVPALLSFPLKFCSIQFLILPSAMALAMGSPVTGPFFAPSIARCSTIQLGRARSVALAFCPLAMRASHIKHWEAKLLSMKGHAAAIGSMPQSGSNVLLASRQPFQRFLLNASSCSFCPPSGRMVRVEAGPASVESEVQSSQGTTEEHVGVLECSEGIRVSAIEPIVDAFKRCSACGYSKLLGDFEDTVTTRDKRTEVCRACLAAIRARRGRELYHLELTPEKAWERAKVCTKCGVRKEFRDFGRNKASKDGTTNQCRSCMSNHNKARPVVLPVDTPQRCNKCNEMKPAADYFVNLKKPTGLHKTCKLCEQKYTKERYLRLKQSNVVVQRHDKVCTSCGQLKLTSEFSKNFMSIDGLCHLCKSCDIAHIRKAREARAGPPASK